jgi:2,5-diketo-D-gluconate reductase A
MTTLQISPATAARTLELRDGNSIPRLGLGTWPMDDEQAAEAVETALAVGYRLIHTAARYGNEAGVGRGIARAGVPREEVFVTTKLRGAQHGYEAALAGFEESRARLGLDYVGLFLIHWPLPARDLYVDTWRAFIALREQGLVRSIGVSNFTPAQTERLFQETGVGPVVNQIELHPHFAQTEAIARDAERGIVDEAWSPLGAGRDLLRDPLIDRLARQHEVTAAQIVLRWHVQRGTIPVPKSADPERQAENLDVFGFELSDSQMASLARHDRGERLGGDPDVYEEL